MEEILMQRAAVWILAMCVSLASCEKASPPEGNDPGEKSGRAAEQPPETPDTPDLPDTPEAPAKDSAGDTAVLPSGLSYEIIEKGTGPSPTLGSRVTLHVTGKLPDGTVFLDTRKDGKPREYKVDPLELITGWVEVLPLMKVGEKRHVQVPSSLAYGAAGYQGVVPPNTDLDFEIELLSIEKE
jgi:FKBP-type peptidyl-prolyl cis-trans isomerase